MWTVWVGVPHSWTFYPERFGKQTILQSWPFSSARLLNNVYIGYNDVAYVGNVGRLNVFGNLGHSTLRGLLNPLEWNAQTYD